MEELVGEFQQEIKRRKEISPETRINDQLANLLSVSKSDIIDDPFCDCYNEEIDYAREELTKHLDHLQTLQAQVLVEILDIKDVHLRWKLGKEATLSIAEIIQDIHEHLSEYEDDDCSLDMVEEIQEFWNKMTDLGEFPTQEMLEEVKDGLKDCLDEFDGIDINIPQNDDQKSSSSEGEENSDNQNEED